MSVYRYEKGADVTVRVNGSALGGVLSAECSEENSPFEVREYLSSAPVASIPQRSWLIELKTLDPLFFAEERELESIELDGENGAELFTSCAVESVRRAIKPQSPVEYAVRIRAGERSVSDGEGA